MHRPFQNPYHQLSSHSKNHKPTYYDCVQNCMHIICCNWDKRGAIANFTERMQDDDDKKGLKYLLEMKNERSKPFPMAKANAFFSRYKRLLMMGAQLSSAQLSSRKPGHKIRAKRWRDLYLHNYLLGLWTMDQAVTVTRSVLLLRNSTFAPHQRP